MDRLSSREQRICLAIAARKQALVDDLRLHVGIPTGEGNTAGLDETRDRFTARLVAMGARAELLPGDPRPAWIGGPTEAEASAREIPPTAICRGPSTNGSSLKHVLIAGHLDTVHPVNGDFRRLSISSDGRTATGPGCVDMKGGLVILVAALEALAECDASTRWTVLFNSDEETGSYHSDAAIRKAAQDADFGLAVEPAMADGGLAIQRGGSAQFLLEAFGRSAHVGRDFFKGASAVTLLAQAIQNIATFPDASKGLVANIGPLQGGIAPNVVADHAIAWGNLRFEDPSGASHLERQLRALETGSDKPGEPGLRLQFSFNRPAKPTTPGVERLAALARRTAEDLGQQLPFGKTGGVCDGNIMQDAIPVSVTKPLGLPTIDTVGVRGGGLHTPQEWIELSSLVERCQLLAVLIARLSERGLTDLA